MSRAYTISAICMVTLGMLALTAGKGPDPKTATLKELEEYVFGHQRSYRMEQTREEAIAGLRVSLRKATDKRYEIMLANPGKESLERFKVGMLKALIAQDHLIDWMDDLHDRYGIFPEESK